MRKILLTLLILFGILEQTNAQKVFYRATVDFRLIGTYPISGNTSIMVSSGGHLIGVKSERYVQSGGTAYGFDDVFMPDLQIDYQGAGSIYTSVKTDGSWSYNEDVHTDYKFTAATAVNKEVFLITTPKSLYCASQTMSLSIPSWATTVNWTIKQGTQTATISKGKDETYFGLTAAEVKGLNSNIDPFSNFEITAVAVYGFMSPMTTTLSNVRFAQDVPQPMTIDPQPPLCFGQNGSLTLSNFVYPDGSQYTGSATLHLTLKPRSGGLVINIPTLNAPSVTIPVPPDFYDIYVEQDVSDCAQTFPGKQVPAIAQDLSATTVQSCVNGKPAVTITAVGGTGPYTYSLNGNPAVASNVFTDLQPGTTYTLTYYDKNLCNKTLSITTPSAVAVASYTTKAPSGTGADGEISITGTGGVGPYSYSLDKLNWQTNNTITGLAAGTYNVWVQDSKGCISAATTVSLVPLDFTATSTQVSCSGYSNGSISIVITGGSSPYKIKLDNGVYRNNDNQFPGLAAGTYEVYVMDSRGVEMHHPVTVGSPTPVNFTYTTSNAICKGSTDGTITINASGGSGGYKYLLVGSGFQPSNVMSVGAGNYTLRVDDVNNCSSATQVASVGEPPLAVSVSLQTRDVLCYNTPTGQIIALQGANGDGNYKYSTDNTTWTSNTVIDQLTAGTYTVYVKDGKGCSGLQNNVKINAPAQLQISQQGTVAPVSCFGLSDGSFSVVASGGSGNVRFFLSTAPTIANTSGIFNNLPAGNYTVIARDDNGCEVSLPVVNIPQPAAMSLAISASPVLCFGQSNGSINVTSINGGNGGYTFSKDDINYSGSQTFANLTANGYTIYAKDTKGCKSSATATVTQPTALSFTTSTTAVLCNGGSTGSIAIQASGGTTPYSYALDNGSFVTTSTFAVAAGDHKIIVQDKNGCQQSTTVTISQPSPLSISITDERKVTCNGGNNGGVTVLGSGGVAPYSYAINGGAYTTNNAFNGLTAGTYSITVKDANQCIASLSAVVTEFTAINYTIVNKIDILCAGDRTGVLQLQGTGGAGGYSYQLDGGSFQTNPSWINLGKKNYSLVIKDANNCTSSFTIPIVELYAPLAMALSSNPPATCADKGSITVTLAQGGRTPYQYSLDNNNYVSSNVFSNLNNGDYIVYVHDAAGCTISQGISPYGPVSIRGSIAATDATCFGKSDGKVVISGVTGGTGIYEYSLNGGNWQSSPIFNNIAGGQTYNVVVRDIPYTCQIQLSAVVKQPTALQPQLLSTRAVSCYGLNNGMIDMTVSGGTPGYTFAIGAGSQITGTFNQLTAGNYNITITDAQGCTSNLPVNITQPQPLVAQLVSVKDIDCFGNGNGSISLSASGGTSPYQYTLNTITQSTPQFNQLQAGNYALKVTDAQGCSQSLSATIAEPSRLTMNVTTEMVKCFGDASGSITLDVKGGKGVYTYTLNSLPGQSQPGFTHLTAGNYLITAKDENLCSVGASPVITQPTPLKFSKQVVQPVCSYSADGSITVDLQGGTTPYNFRWTNAVTASTASLTNLKGGLYELTIKDNNGCTLSDQTLLTQPAAMPLDLGFSDTTLCVGQQLPLDAGNPGAKYQWRSQEGFSATTQQVTLGKDGHYNLTITNGAGCTAKADFVLRTSLSVLKADFLMSSYNTLGDTLILVDISKPKPLSLEWTLPEGIREAGASADGSVRQLLFNKTGTYNIQLFTRLGECADAITKTVIVVPEQDRGTADSILGYREKLIRNITIYPNPTTGQFKVGVELSKEAAVTIRLIYFNDGNLMEMRTSQSAKKHEVPFSIGALPQGTYLIGVQADKEYEVRKMIKL